MVMQCKEISTLGSSVRTSLAKALGEAKNNTLLHARGVDHISVESGNQHPLSSLIQREKVLVILLVIISNTYPYVLCYR